MKGEFFNVRLNLTLFLVYAVIYHELDFIIAGGEKVMIPSLSCQRKSKCDISGICRGRRNYTELNLKILTKCSFTLLKAQCPVNWGRAAKIALHLLSLFPTTAFILE